MDSLEGLKLEEIDPWHPNLNRVTVGLKEGLDIGKLSTTGADIEFVPKSEVEITELEEEEEEENGEVYQHKVLEYLNPECADFHDDDENDENMTPFAKMALSMEDVTGDGKVLKKVLSVGVGPVVPDGAMVRVHYNGYLEYSDEPYDSSRLRNKEQQFRLGRGEVLIGWDVGIATMKKTELARFLIHPAYAFGEIGCPPRIPPNATIMFEIEVLSFVDLKAADNFDGYSRQEREQASLDELITVANAIREEGNDFFQQNNFYKAANKYKKAIRILEDRRLKDAEEEKKWKRMLIKLYLNHSLCCLRMHKPKIVITQCRKVLDLEEKNVKATFRLGQAYMQLSEFDKSRKYLIQSGKLLPSSTEIRQELEKLDRAVRKFKSMEKKLYTKMFPSTKPSTGSSLSDNENDDDDDDLSPEQLEEYRELYQEKLSMMKDNPDMMELVIPLPLSRKERTCAESIASQLDLLTEMLPGSGLRVYKELPEEVEELLKRH